MSDLLKALGPRGDTLATLDFETFYDKEYTLRKLTTESYVRDPRFETIGVGVKLGKRPSVWLEEWEFREWAARVDWSRVAVNAHHAQFDAFILSHHYGIKPGFLFCTMSMARALHGVSGVGLGVLAPLYGLGEKGKEIENAKGKRRKDFTEVDWLKFGDYCNQDVALTDGLLRKMSPGFPKEELWVIDGLVRMFTEPVFEADQALLRKALIEERAKKAELLKRVAETAGAGGSEDVHEAARAVLSSSDKFAALLRSMGEEPPTKPNDKGEAIYAFAKTDPGMQALLDHPRDDIRFLAEARQSVKSTITETRVDRIIGIAERGRVPFYLKYCGAHTHRHSGGDKMNPQNFNRGGVLRDATVAPAGHVLVVADSGQIEARVLPWLAGQSNLLETFRRNDATGGDFYSDVGGEYFRKKLSKKETPIERQLAKNMVLGLGFGMGWGKFAGELLKGMLGSDPVQFGEKEAVQYAVNPLEFEARVHGRGPETCGGKVEDLRTFGIRLPYEQLLIHCAVTDYFVRLYRQNNGQIVRLWRSMEDVLKVMEIPGGDPAEVRMTFGPLKILRHGILKPSGLVMRYPGLKRSSSGYHYLGGKSGREHVKVYGGLIAENVTQSVARDIVVADQALWVRAGGYRLGTTTHDELVAVVPEARGKECLDYMLARMRTPPPWCADLPLNASGGFGKSYGAVK